jgi:hypothetical protein
VIALVVGVGLVCGAVGFAAGLAVCRRRVLGDAPACALVTDSPLWRASVHEAGHAVAAWLCTAVLAVHEVRVGHVRGEPFGHVRLTERGSAEWCRLVIVLAGVAADQCIYRAKARSRPYASDLNQARALAAVLSGQAPPWSVEGPTLPFTSLLEGLSDGERAVLDVGYRRAAALVRSHRNAVLHVASALAASGEVGQSKLEEMLGSRDMTRAIGATRADFIGS